MNDIGDNSTNDLGRIIERIERLEEEKKQIASDIGDIYKETKSRGFDATAVKEIVRIRREDPAKREARETMVDIYMRALNGWEGTPLGAVAK